MAHSGILIGIDLGTSSVKALAIDGSGHIWGRAKHHYEMQRPFPGWVEQSPLEWWNAVRYAIRKLGEQVDLSRTTGIGLSGQLNGLVLVDKAGNPLTEAPIWLDQRATEQSQFLSEHWLDTIHAIAFGNPGPIHSLSKLLWFQDNVPELILNTHKLLFPKDYITFKLTDQFVTDTSDAGATLMLDLGTREWAKAFLSKLEIPLEILPTLHESPDVVGAITSLAASETGLPVGIPVVAGAGDMGALAVGTGVITEGSACTTIGTAGHIALYCDSVPQQVDHRLWMMCHALPGKYFWHGLVMTGGHCLTWFLDNFGQDEQTMARPQSQDPYDLILNYASRVPPGSQGLIFLPFLDGASTPYYDPGAQAAFVGATTSTGKPTFTRAVLEGVAYNFRDTFEIFAELGYAIKGVQAGEGGSRHPLWPTIIADVLGLPVNILSELDSSALGASIIAGVGTDIWRDFTEATRLAVRTTHKILPDSDHHRLYTKQYRRYQQAYAALRPLY